MVHRVAPVSVSSSLRPHICECSEGYSGGAGPLVALHVYLPHSILIYEAPDEKTVSTIFKVFGMTQPGLEPMTF